MQGQQTQEEYSLLSTRCLSHLAGTSVRFVKAGVQNTQKYRKAMRVCPDTDAQKGPRTYLVVQQLRLCQPMQGTSKGTNPWSERRSYMPQSSQARASRLLS